MIIYLNFVASFVHFRFVVFLPAGRLMARDPVLLLALGTAVPNSLAFAASSQFRPL